MRGCQEAESESPWAWGPGLCAFVGPGAVLYLREVGLKSVASVRVRTAWGRASPSRIELGHESEHELEHESRRLGIARALCVCESESRRRGGLGCSDCMGWA
jgi:hypothetical protein